MKKKAKTRKPLPPLIYLKGSKEAEAIYKEQLVPEYRNHPLIEALPSIWSRGEVIDRLTYLPLFSEEYRDLPPEIRNHTLENCREVFVPSGIHLEIEIKISRSLRRGLLRRNPSLWSYWTELDGKIAELSRNLEKGIFLQTKARGFCIVGVGGVGKSSAVETILLQYPQVITHTTYRGEYFIFTHLVWLKLDCPQDGSARSLCVNFFRAVDEILGTDYETRFVRERSSASTLLPQMARVAALHCLGVLAIDEVQNLSEAASGGASQLINFFVQLENTIGVPVILVATDEAQHLFSGKFHHARRLSEQGDIIWNPMEEKVRKTKEEIEEWVRKNPGKPVELYKPNPVWEVLVRALWEYQYVRNPVELNDDLLKDKLAHALHKHSFGITGLAAAIYMFAQGRAITTGVEKLTTAIIESVAKDSINFIQEFVERHRLRGNHKIFKKAETAEETDDPTRPAPPAEDTPAGTDSATESEQSDAKALQTTTPSRPGRNGSVNRERQQIQDIDDIRGLASAISEGVAAHEAFKTAGHIRSSTEFLKGAGLQ